jgi:peptidoglycan hydrolase-like protein with peptidoglycan-binding domain
MLPKRMTVQLIAFLVLSGGVAANVFFLQTSGRGAQSARVSDATAWNIAAIEAAEFGGDTGSIERGARDTTQAPTINLAAVPSAGDAAKGSATEVTRAIQRELQIRGYETGGSDGIAGLMTRGAIMAYEYDHNLPLSGQPSDRLLKAIILGEGGKSKAKGGEVKTAEAQDVVRSVQRSLAKLGYKPGAPNGRLTPDTLRAIRAFEGDQALPETGRITGPLIARLLRLSGDGRVAAAP